MSLSGRIGNGVVSLIWAAQNTSQRITVNLALTKRGVLCSIGDSSLILA